MHFDLSPLVAFVSFMEPALYPILFACTLVQAMCASSQGIFLLRRNRGASAAAIAWFRHAVLGVRFAVLGFLAQAVTLVAALQLQHQDLVLLSGWALALGALNHLVLQPLTIRVLQGRRIFTTA